MPHVTVIFDTRKADQSDISALKRALPNIVSQALSDTSLMNQPNSFAAIKVAPQEVLVMQREAHESDVNVSPIEILIEAGAPKGRDQEEVAARIEKLVRELECMPQALVQSGQCCVWLKFSPVNAFRFIGRETD
ncbi:MAG TPA: hypothetical protein VHD38_01080 [Candidatus Paceibacterota bacterium]|jgi:hypothetical protein|nr:hypothetical protein [Candidatus Paceibacterota bacterium]